MNNAVGVLGLSSSAQGVALYARNTGGGYGIYSENNVAQNLNRGGLVKAMIYVDFSGGIRQCYNGVTNSSGGNCGFTVDPQGGFGVLKINLGFRVDDRFVSVTAHYGFGGTTPNNMGANFKFINPTTRDIVTFDVNAGEDSYPVGSCSSCTDGGRRRKRQLHHVGEYEPIDHQQRAGRARGRWMCEVMML